MHNLKRFRKDAGLTLDELATSSRLSKSYIWSAEQGIHNPTLTTAYALANVLGKTVYEIWPDTTEIEKETIIVRRVKK